MHVNPATAVNLRVELALLAVLACLWGSSYLLIKVALATIPPVTLMAVRVTLAAVFLVVSVDSLRGLGQQTLAQAAVLFGAFIYACAALNGKRLAHLSPLVSATGTLLWAAVSLVPLSLLLEQPRTLSPSSTSLLAATTLAILGTGIALIIYFRLMRTLGAMAVASQSYLRAGVSVLLGLIVLGERLSATILIGLVVTIVGVALINWPTRKPRTSSSLSTTNL